MRPSQLPVALTTAALLLGAALPLRADDTTVNYAYPTESPGFFHRVGDFFRDLFATEQRLGPAPTPPLPTAPRYNLDLPAPGTGYGYGRVTPHQSPDTTEQNTVDMYPTKPRAAKKTSTTVSSTTTAKKATYADNSTAHKPKKPAPVIAEGDGGSSSPQVRMETRTVTTKAGITESKSVPVGTHTSKATRVKSPFPPYNELDITGLQSGSLAQDPTTNKVFRVP